MAYTVSDEISLVFAAAHVIQSPPSNVEDDVESRPATEDQQVQESNSSSTTSTTTNPKKKRKVEKPKNHPYNGRIMKLATVAASYASARFNLHLTTETWTDLGNPVVESRMLEHTAHFDARVVPCASAQLVMECLFWRSNFDG